MEWNREKELSDACDRGVYDVVCYLLETVPGLDVNYQDDYGITPLMRACSSGRLDIVRRLVEAGANVDAPKNNGHSALCWTCWEGCVSKEKNYANIVRYLVRDCRANVNVASDTGQTALMWVCQWRYRSALETIRLLVVDGGADVNASTYNGWTPLMFAGLRGNSECLDVVRYLVTRCGADVSARTSGGEMAIDMVRNTAVFSFLLSMMGGPGRLVPEAWRGA